MLKKVSVFFYGSFMRADVMAKSSVSPAQVEVAQLQGYDITLDPHANIFPCAFASVFGILVKVTHEELTRMYGVSGVGVFLPEAVLVKVGEGSWMPALCFMPPGRSEKKPDLAYLVRLIEAAVVRGLPQNYIDRLQKFSTP